MTLMRTYLAALVALILCGMPAFAGGDTTGLSKVELRPGWRMADGTHMAALHIVLEPGWKTYWRAPGDFGIPPQFDWAGSHNIDAVSPKWPTPDVFFEQGMRSVGYRREVVIPLHLVAKEISADIEVSGEVHIGIC